MLHVSCFIHSHKVVNGADLSNRPQYTHASAITEGGDKNANLLANFSGHLAQMNDLISNPVLDISQWKMPGSDKTLVVSFHPTPSYPTLSHRTVSYLTV